MDVPEIVPSSSSLEHTENGERSPLLKDGQSLSASQESPHNNDARVCSSSISSSTEVANDADQQAHQSIRAVLAILSVLLLGQHNH